MPKRILVIHTSRMTLFGHDYSLDLSKAFDLSIIIDIVKGISAEWRTLSFQKEWAVKYKFIKIVQPYRWKYRL